MPNFGSLLKKQATGTQTALQGAMPSAQSLGSGGVVRRDLAAERMQQEGQQQVAQATRAAEAGLTQQQEQMKQQGLQVQQMRQQTAQDITASMERYRNSSEAVLMDLTQNMDRLTQAEKHDKVEQAAAQFRLSNEKYRWQLEDTGRRMRLTDAAQFDIALQESIFDEEMDLLRSDLDFKRMLDADEAEFTKYLANIDINTAIALAKESSEAASTTSMIGGLGTAATAAFAPEEI